MARATTTTTLATASISASQQTITVADASNFSVGSILTSESATNLGISGSVRISAINNNQIKITYKQQTTTSVTSGKTITQTMPAKLWDLTYMRNYFYDQTISDMRRYYCEEDFAADMTGGSVDSRCFGYLSVRTNNYVLLPGVKKP
jgi:hypothetical protein